MKLLLDECVPRRLKRDFFGHDVLTIDEAGFKGLKNGKLIDAAKQIFEVLITVDKNIRHQQNKDKLSIAIIVLSAKSNQCRNLYRVKINVKNLKSQFGIIANIKLFSS